MSQHEEQKEENVSNEELTYEELLQQRDEYLNGWKRAMADYSNLKKEHAQKSQDLSEYVTMRVVHEFLAVYENFKSASSHKPTIESKEWENWAMGIDHIEKQFTTVLTDMGIVEINVIGGLFDPHIHESIEDVIDETVPSGHVVKIVKCGYKYKDHVLMPAKVIIAQ